MKLLVALALAATLPLSSCSKHEVTKEEKTVARILRIMATPHEDRTVTLVSEAVRGAVSGTASVGTQTGTVDLQLISSTWTSLTGANSVTVNVTVDRSFDGGATWNPALGSQFVSPSVRKDGGLPNVSVALDGVASTWRVTFVPSVNFSYGIQATF